jgi:hypothetical protein
MGWDGFQNGKLLQAAEDDGFDLLVTGDQRWAIVVMSCVEWRIVKDYLGEIRGAVDGSAPGSFRAVDCGSFDRRKTTDE